MYTQTTQGWTEAPLGFKGGDPNVRRYVGNNPTNLADPSGLQSVTVEKPGTEVKLSPDKQTFELAPGKKATIRIFKGFSGKVGDVVSKNAMRIQILTENEQDQKKIHFLQFVKRDHKPKGKNAELLPITKLDYDKMKDNPFSKATTTVYTKANSGEWNIDSQSYFSILYDFMGLASRGKEGNQFEVSLFDTPGLFNINSWKEETVSFKTYVLYDNQVVYELDWTCTASQKGNKWEDPGYDVTFVGPVKDNKPAKFDVDLKSKTFLWYYKDEAGKSPYRMENDLLKK